MRHGLVTACALGALSLALASGCSREDPDELLTSSSNAASTGSESGSGPTSTSGSGGGDTTSGTGGSSTGSTSGTGGSEEICPTTELDDRVMSYTEALRSASFKIVGNAPTLQQIDTLEKAADQATQYAAYIDEMLADPRFGTRMVEFWRSALRMDGKASNVTPSRDTAPVFAARIVAEGRPYTDLMTASVSTCPTFDSATQTFADGECNNNITPVGILTDPGVHSLFYGNMAFRRNRFFHETFLCRGAMEPVAEPTNTPGAGGPAGYASPWPWNSIAGGPTAQIDFLHDTGTICANCHATWNHRAPLFGMFDANGMFTGQFEVNVPAINLPLALRTDWLPDAEMTAWKFGVPVANLAEMGAAIAADTEVHTCAVARMWNYAMSRGDIVETGYKVADGAIAPLVTELQTNGFNLKDTLRSILLSDDFVRF